MPHSSLWSRLLCLSCKCGRNGWAEGSAAHSSFKWGKSLALCPSPCSKNGLLPLPIVRLRFSMVNRWAFQGQICEEIEKRWLSLVSLTTLKCGCPFHLDSSIWKCDTYCSTLCLSELLSSICISVQWGWAPGMAHGLHMRRVCRETYSNEWVWQDYILSVHFESCWIFNQLELQSSSLTSSSASLISSSALWSNQQGTFFFLSPLTGRSPLGTIVH